MLHYRSVLCAVDFSEETSSVVARAHMIAERAKAKFCLVHVLERAPMAYGGGEYSVPLDMNLEEVLNDRAKRSLENMVEQMGAGDIDWHLVEGSIKHGVSDLAKGLQCDLIVVGCHGQHGMGMLIGGNANGILHAAHCDVLAVHVD